MENSKAIELLRRIPSTDLRLIALARDIIKEDGELDLDKLTFRMDELGTAVDEARAYVQDVSKAISWLQNLRRCLR